jgi:hypothetical protein
MESSTKFIIQLRKRKELTHLEFTINELKSNPVKVLNIMKKEYIDLKSWFLIIVKKKIKNFFLKFKKILKKIKDVLLFYK